MLVNKKRKLFYCDKMRYTRNNIFYALPKTQTLLDKITGLGVNLHIYEDEVSCIKINKKESLSSACSSCL